MSREAAGIAEAAGKLIVETYQRGVRDPDQLVRHALITLRQGRPGRAVARRLS